MIMATRKLQERQKNKLVHVRMLYWKWGWLWHLSAEIKWQYSKKGALERPSDTDGILRIEFNDHIREIVPKLAQRLQGAGFEINPEKNSRGFRMTRKRMYSQDTIRRENVLQYHVIDQLMEKARLCAAQYR